MIESDFKLMGGLGMTIGD